ncbi:MAG: hypothetical protein LBK25_04140 [Treponema sp.]|nr:hypothetical protein [Treponema sp.]
MSKGRRASEEQRVMSNEQRAKEDGRVQSRKRYQSAGLLLTANSSLVGVSGDSFLTTTKFRLQSKRNRQDGDRGAPFRTTTRVKLSNTLRVC